VGFLALSLSFLLPLLSSLIMPIIVLSPFFVFIESGRCRTVF